MNSTKLIIDYILARGVEPSTYAGLAVLLADIHVSLTGADITGLTTVLVAAFSFAAIILKEKGIA